MLVTDNLSMAQGNARIAKSVVQANDLAINALTSYLSYIFTKNGRMSI